MTEPLPPRSATTASSCSRRPARCSGRSSTIAFATWRPSWAPTSSWPRPREGWWRLIAPRAPSAGWRRLGTSGPPRPCSPPTSSSSSRGKATRWRSGAPTGASAGASRSRVAPWPPPSPMPARSWPCGRPCPSMVVRAWSPSTYERAQPGGRSRSSRGASAARRS